MNNILHEKTHWDSVSRSWLKLKPQRLWRIHSDAVNSALLARWLPDRPIGHLLKTDLFDEAVSGGLYHELASKCRHLISADLTHSVIMAARQKYPDLVTVASDVRHLPFSSGSFDMIVSNSTLDHFPKADDILVSLKELWRVLQKGGCLILTLDNLSNPAVALRQCLPNMLLRRAGIVPYYVGRTLRPRILFRYVERAGFDVKEKTAIMHCPRMAAVAFAYFLEKRRKQKGGERLLKMLMAFEHLGRLHTRYLSGHFTALLAIKKRRPEYPGKTLNSSF